MIFVVSCLSLLFLLVFLVGLYHLYFWSFSDNVYGGLSRVWVSSFECGFLGVSLVENVFSYTYFILLVFFVIFDLEISLLVNISYQGVLFKNFFFYFMFILILVLGYYLEVRKGFVSWNY